MIGFRRKVLVRTKKAKKSLLNSKPVYSLFNFLKQFALENMSNLRNISLLGDNESPTVHMVMGRCISEQCAPV